MDTKENSKDGLNNEPFAQTTQFLTKRSFDLVKLYQNILLKAPFGSFQSSQIDI